MSLGGKMGQKGFSAVGSLLSDRLLGTTAVDGFVIQLFQLALMSGFFVSQVVEQVLNRT